MINGDLKRIAARDHLPAPLGTAAPYGRWLSVLIIALTALEGRADTIGSDADVQGRNLAIRLLDQRPTENFTATGVLTIRSAAGEKMELPAKLTTTITATNWQNDYQAGGTNEVFLLTILHAKGLPDVYYYHTNLLTSASSSPAHPPLQGVETSVPFAESDFWVGDLGVQFLQWPRQRVLKKEIKRSRGCAVLESTSPGQSGKGYSRVVSWIDTESGGIVQAKAYDPDGQLLKEFYPKDLKKVNGQWQVGMMEMDNDQTGSRTRLEFDLGPATLPKK